MRAMERWNGWSGPLLQCRLNLSSNLRAGHTASMKLFTPTTLDLINHWVLTVLELSFSKGHGKLSPMSFIIHRLVRKLMLQLLTMRQALPRLPWHTLPRRRRRDQGFGEVGICYFFPFMELSGIYFHIVLSKFAIRRKLTEMIKPCQRVTFPHKSSW